MDRIKPVDIERTRFRKTFRGYDPDEVDDMMARVTCEIETLLIELRGAQAGSQRLTFELDGFRSQESTLRDALLLAQRMADETRAEAERQADAILARARADADDLHAELHGKISDLRWELEKLRLEKQKFLDALRTTLEDALRAVDSAERSEIASQEPKEPDGPVIQVV